MTLRTTVGRLLGTFRRRDADADLDEEMRTHLEMHVDEFVRRGMMPVEARRQALLTLGGIDQTKERYRDRRGCPFLESLVKDVRFGLRMLVRNPGFTAVAILILAIGIGANTAFYSIVDATLLRPLPFADPDRLMHVSLVRPPERGEPADTNTIWSYPKYQTFRELQDVFTDTAVHRVITSSVLSGDPEPERVRAEYVGSKYFELLGGSAVLGRTFLTEEDQTPQTHFVMVLSHALWQRRFGGDSTIIGRSVTFNAQPYTVVGVMQQEFVSLNGPVDLWVPSQVTAVTSLRSAGTHSWEVVARLKPDVTADQARERVQALGAVIDSTHPMPGGSDGQWGATLSSLNDRRIDPTIRRSALVLFAATGCLLLLACANLANLMLVRSGARQRELAVRMAIGASRGRVIRQLLTESVVLSLLGAGASLIVAWGALDLITSYTTGTASIFGTLSGLTTVGMGRIELDARALAFTSGIAILAGLVCGLAPALQVGRAQLVQSIRPSAGWMSIGGRHFQRRDLLMVSEIALALMLLVGAGLLVRTLERLTSLNVGVDARNMLSFRVTFQGTARPGVIRLTELERRIEGIPGVLSVGMTDCAPLAGRCGATLMGYGSIPVDPSLLTGTEPLIGYRFVSPEYFQTMRAPMVRGRGFTEADASTSPRVIVINETAARQLWPGQDPIGQRIGFGYNGFDKDVEVIGVVGDIRHGRAEEPPTADVYVSLRQAPQTGALVFLRASGDPLALIPAIRQQLADVDASAPISDIRMAESRFQDATARSRFSAILMSLFAAVATALAAIGIYGVLSSVVAMRTREIGVRLALGALPGQVLAKVLAQGALVIGVGVVLGLAGAVAASRALSTLLFGIEPLDPSTYIGTSLLLAAVGIAAAWLPARRASRVNPIVALKTD